MNNESFFDQQENAIVSEPSSQNLAEVHHEDLYQQLERLPFDFELPSFAAFIGGTQLIDEVAKQQPENVSFSFSKRVSIARFDNNQPQPFIHNNSVLGMFTFEGFQFSPYKVERYEQYQLRAQQDEREQAVIVYQSQQEVVYFVNIGKITFQSYPQTFFDYFYCRTLMFFNQCERNGYESIILSVPQSSNILLVVHAIAAALLAFFRSNASSTVILQPFGRECEYLLRCILPVYFPRNETEEKLGIWRLACSITESKAEQYINASNIVRTNPKIMKLLSNNDIYTVQIIPPQESDNQKLSLLKRRVAEEDLTGVQNLQVLEFLQTEQSYFVQINAFLLQELEVTEKQLWELTAWFFRNVGISSTQKIKICYCGSCQELRMFLEANIVNFPTNFANRVTKIYMLRVSSGWKVFEQYFKEQILECEMLDEIRAMEQRIKFSTVVMEWDEKFK